MIEVGWCQLVKSLCLVVRLISCGKWFLLNANVQHKVSALRAHSHKLTTGTLP